MNNIKLEELFQLLAIIPKGTVFQLGLPPENMRNTLSLQVYCMLSDENAKRMQSQALAIEAAHNTVDNLAQRLLRKNRLASAPNSHKKRRKH